MADNTTLVPKDVGTQPTADTSSAPVSAYDPIIGILGAFSHLPPEYHEDLFRDFGRAVEEKNLRRLLDTISDWAATAELYANRDLDAEVTEARAGRQGVADWLPGR